MIAGEGNASLKPILAILSSDYTTASVAFWPRGYKAFFMLNSIEHEILNAHRYKNIKKFSLL